MTRRCISILRMQVAAEKMEAARAGQKTITGTNADLRKLGMQEARQQLLAMAKELKINLTDEDIASAPSPPNQQSTHHHMLWYHASTPSAV